MSTRKPETITIKCLEVKDGEATLEIDGTVPLLQVRAGDTIEIKKKSGGKLRLEMPVTPFPEIRPS